MYIVTDGKNYVMKDPINAERWLVSTNINHAYVGSLKQAKRILRMKRFSPSKGFHMVDHDTGNTVPKEVENYRGSAGAFLGENEISLDGKILDEIFREARGILGLAGWDMTQLNTYMNQLSANLAKYDSAISDIEHVLQEYESKHDGRKPPANKAAKLSYLLLDVRGKRGRIKQCQCYIRVMQDAITNHYPLDKLKLELSKVTYVDYKGRTEYYNLALNILN